MTIKVLTYDLTDYLTDGVYLHGNLWSNPASSDLCELKHVPAERGIYECDVVMPDGNIVKANLYFWFSSYGRNRGLIVAPDDTEGIAFATQKFEENSEVL